MNKILKTAITAALLITGVGVAPASAQVRVRPVVSPTGPVKPTAVLQVRPLTSTELQARMKLPPRFLTGPELKARVPGNIAAQAIPDLKAAFSLTPAVQSVGGRGAMKIDGQVYLPNPAPPGFPGQAIIRRGVSGGIGQVGFTGGVYIELNTAKDTFYILDCLAAMRGASSRVQFKINQSYDATPSEMYLSDGRFILTVPKQKENGVSKIVFYPEMYSSDKNGPEMDFWGCQISTGG